MLAGVVGRPRGPAQLMRVDLEKLFADIAANTLQDAEAYEMPCGTIPQEMGGGGNLAIDPAEDYAYFSVGREEARRHLDPNVEIQDTFGPRRMGAGPGGLARMNLATGQIRLHHIRAVSGRACAGQSVEIGRDRVLLGNRRQGPTT